MKIADSFIYLFIFIILEEVFLKSSPATTLVAWWSCWYCKCRSRGEKGEGILNQQLFCSVYAYCSFKPQEQKSARGWFFLVCLFVLFLRLKCCFPHFKLGAMHSLLNLFHTFCESASFNIHMDLLGLRTSAHGATVLTSRGACPQVTVIL